MRRSDTAATAGFQNDRGQRPRLQRCLCRRLHTIARMRLRMTLFGLSVFAESPAFSDLLLCSILFFHECFQPRECVVPLRGYAGEVIMRFCQRFRLELVKTFPADRFRPHQPGLFQNTQMLLNCLPRNCRSRGQLRDRPGMSVAQPVEKPQSPFIAERSENRCAVMKPPCLSECAMPARHDVRRSSSARSSHRRSCGMLRRDDRQGVC